MIRTIHTKRIFGGQLHLINGQLQPTGANSMERLVLQLAQTIPRPTSPYGIIYINSLAPASAYNDFKKTIELFPMEYLQHLTHVYVLEPSLFNKAVSLFSFGSISNYIRSKTVNLKGIGELCQETKIEEEELLKMLPRNVVRHLGGEVEPAPAKRKSDKRRIFLNPSEEKMEERGRNRSAERKSELVVGEESKQVAKSMIHCA